MDRSVPAAGSSAERFRREVIETERAFCALACRVGTPEAFHAYAAEDCVLLRHGQPPIQGRAMLKAEFKAPPNSTLEWEPTKVDASPDGDIAYAIGTWVLRRTAEDGSVSVTHGVYTTVWKRQEDGSLKFVYDGGAPSHPPGPPPSPQPAPVTGDPGTSG